MTIDQYFLSVFISTTEMCWRVWRYQERSNQNPSIEKGQKTQWPKENGQTTIYKTLSRKLKIEQHKHSKN